MPAPTVDVAAYTRDGFALLRGFASTSDTAAMLDATIDIARRADRGDDVRPAFVTPEANLASGGASAFADAEDAVSKVFRVHAQPGPFLDFASRPDLTEIVATLIGASAIDCFLSQFIFKNPGAWGQPCHQDSFYFPFEPPRPVVGAWLAVTDAHHDNGPLFIVPASHVEQVHEHVPDRRPNANLGYFEIVDHDLSPAVVVEMEPGDLLLFDSHLMHFSTDNTSSRRRAAMVWHFAAAGTVDHTVERRGYTINDWVPVRRAS
jgi:ectoine hydroxylase-related dioxygenase (phytanoyl-CoA dioxygenase family)